MASDWDALLRRLRRQGFVVEDSGHGLRCYHPNSPDETVWMSKTPSDVRAVKNAESNLRKIGYRKK